jgi:hypothetical protein
VEVPSGLFRALALFTNRGAVRGLLGLPDNYLRARLPRLKPWTVSRRATRHILSVCRLAICAYRDGATFGDCGTDPTGRFRAASSWLRMSVQRRKRV